MGNSACWRLSRRRGMSSFSPMDDASPGLKPPELRGGAVRGSTLVYHQYRSFTLLISKFSRDPTHLQTNIYYYYVDYEIRLFTPHVGKPGQPDRERY